MNYYVFVTALYLKLFLNKLSLFNVQIVIMCGLAVQVQVLAMLTKEIVIPMKTASEIWFVGYQIVLALNFLSMQTVVKAKVHIFPLDLLIKVMYSFKVIKNSNLALNNLVW